MMVAYNFAAEFAPEVEARRKRQTLRMKPRAKVGDKIQLYTGQRTRSCRKLSEVDPVCTRTAEIKLYEDCIMFDGHRQSNETTERYAILDGFESYKHMRAWFLDRYGEIPTRLFETRWDWEDGE